MRILIIVNDLKNGGVERVLSVLANYFAQKNYDIHILAIASSDISYLLSNKVKYEYSHIMEIYKKVSLVENFRIVGRIKREINRINPDCVIGFDDSIIIRSIPSAWMLRIKIIVSERIDPSIYGLPMRIVRQICYDMANKVVFQTEEARDFFPKRTRRKSVVIPNPLTQNLPYRKSRTNNDILMACRLRNQKNVSLAINAFALFHKTHSDYRLAVYGEGELLEQLKAEAFSMGVGESVAFLGYTNDIHERMAECSMYLSTSDYEGISNSMLEALAIGVPSICTDCPVGGARMFIKTDENGILVPTGDADAVSKAMSKIADDLVYADKIGKKATDIRNILSSDVICSQWEKLLL